MAKINLQTEDDATLADKVSLAKIAENSNFVSGIFSVGKDSLLEGENNINLVGKVSPAFHAKWKILLKNLAVSLKHVVVDTNIRDDKVFVKDLDIKANIVQLNNKVGWLNHTVTCGELINLLLKETRYGIDTLMVKLFSEDHRFIIGETADNVSSFWTEYDEQISLLSKQTTLTKIKEINAKRVTLDAGNALPAVMTNLATLSEQSKAEAVSFSYLKGAILFELMLADSNVKKVFDTLCTTSNSVLSNKLASVFSILSSLYDILVDSRDNTRNKDRGLLFLDRSNAQSSIAIKVN